MEVTYKKKWVSVCHFEARSMGSLVFVCGNIYTTVLRSNPLDIVATTKGNYYSFVKAIIHFRNSKKKKVHRFTNNLQGLQKVMVKYFSWNIIPWNSLLFEKNLKQLPILDNENYGFILNTCHDTAKRAETRVCFPVIFSRRRWPIELKFLQVCCFIHELWYTRVGLGQYCIPQLTNCFNERIISESNFTKV